MDRLVSSSDPFIHVRVEDGRPVVRGTPSISLGHRIQREGSPPDGVFGGWTWDGVRLRAFNDRLGFYPLYYYVHDGECGISSSIPRLLELGAPTALDFPALAVFFRLGYFIGEDTPFKAVRALPPDAVFEWSRGILSVSGQIAKPALNRINREEAEEAYSDLFKQAIRRRLPTGESAVLLSGGRDSRHILFELIRQGARPSFCFTLDFEMGEDEADAKVARQVARAIGIPHVMVPTKRMDFDQEVRKNPMTNFCADEHAWFIPAAEHLAGKVSIVYDGIGGDVLSAGLLLTRERIDLAKAGRFRDLAINLMGGHSNDAILRRSVREKTGAEVAIQRIVEELKKHEAMANPVGSFIFWNRTRREIALSPYRMLSGIDTVFSPYLDYDVYDFLGGLPGEMFVDHSFHNGAINRAFPEYAHIPYAAHDSPPPPRSHLLRFAVRLARYAFTRPSSLVKKDALFARLLRCCVDPRYLSAVLWLGPAAMYLLQLEECSVKAPYSSSEVQ